MVNNDIGLRLIGRQGNKTIKETQGFCGNTKLRNSKVVVYINDFKAFKLLRSIALAIFTHIPFFNFSKVCPHTQKISLQLNIQIMAVRNIACFDKALANRGFAP
jgi:hypothetical protein